MPLNKVVKDKVIKKYATCEGDTGSPEVQIALITERITQLVEHIKSNKKDQSSRRGLLILVGQRRRLLNYLGRVDAKRYATLTASLGLK
ncbi:30S ribosomal protein S15 [candidate division WOR-1 bacterium RIFOXYD2_FULL_36_8]|uniref:Small ribosomal subunit protein uS15 n=1 Tax=candidate division WOR-1 bacterium RIFOXYB2_FULL_36_35 TaxID=1802578 RepID=A0A1F4S675_UNCSA|nr:MAG: 30S ribosomal protein S15 [candidate division WOR-1 bacterium RIFOXYA2_FULL_36_21]OGC15867.1 MAG: 30S ribosomal protein S15 [candidate division WOR-1 bacterium RIFOXYB2_FULL_36_35]OGC21128.1 MAG: 30S ribosomal protein S15 [candidate division WOR-1 bacterium RIFOXYA12_FULL_36_13]OGC41265.1 MAG: 30S ribosomal protein S15 [candidate division WOR-1 bacterium RIFOXYD2_FULL_36_8]